MSYCRYNEGDVYMYKGAFGQIHCHTCQYYYSHPLDAYLHLVEHEQEGDYVPERAYERLEKEITTDNWRIEDDS